MDKKQKQDLLIGAKIGIDESYESYSRGVYIADGTGMFYMTKDGEWTYGIRDKSNCWGSDEEALDFLRIERERECKDREDGEVCEVCGFDADQHTITLRLLSNREVAIGDRVMVKIPLLRKENKKERD